MKGTEAIPISLGRNVLGYWETLPMAHYVFSFSLSKAFIQTAFDFFLPVYLQVDDFFFPFYLCPPGLHKTEWWPVYIKDYFKVITKVCNKY